ncbi:hypothetical protein K0U00_19615, partial [Paenibacillus sepulcri]|nr:hypothetical protein [Paenibacillus sepulcri]
MYGPAGSEQAVRKMMMLDEAPKWHIYLVAGVASTPTIFDECKRELKHRFHEAGRDPVIRELLPYGDHTQSMVRQIIQVGVDLTRFWISHRPGGRAVAAQVRELSAGHPVLFIGHSGGGVAAYRAALLLNREGILPDCRIIQVGSPKTPIRRDLREKVSYFQAVDEDGILKDPITRLGSWGGWSRNKLGVPFWNRLKHAPGHLGTITVLGGHPHYFRSKEPYLHPQRGSNLS